MKKTLPLALAAVCFCVPLFSQEALKSTEEEYYDFLSLTGITKRPTLGYRTLSDSEWNLIATETPVLDADGNAVLDENGNPLTETAAREHVWQHNNLGTKRTLWQSQSEGENWFTRGFDHALRLKIYGPEWYNSYNTAAPYGQNDGALWQGKGYNTSLTGGARLEGFGFEVTVKPQVSFSQNRSFELMPSAYDSEYGYFWGYSNNVGIDAPQRFGNKAFWTFDWGDTEIRWSWRNLTIGFGTQSPWLGPAWLNPILHSNNAATYPKFDIGLRKTAIHLPWLGWYIGDIEGRMWMGYLTESDYFDNDNSNNHNRINGFTFSYAPSFLNGFSIGVTKVCLSKWNNFELNYINPFYHENGGVGTTIGEDQKFSFYTDWIFSAVGLEIYSELGVDDYTPNRTSWGLFRYPFDTMIYTIGLKKSLTLSKTRELYGEVIFEWNSFEQNAHRANSTYSYYFHHQVTQGYTNKGQNLSAGFAPGLNSQHLAFKLYYPKGNGIIFINRYNVDNNYAISKWLNDENYSYKANLAFGGTTGYFIMDNLYVSLGIIWDIIINPYYDNVFDKQVTKQNFSFHCSVKYTL